MTNDKNLKPFPKGKSGNPKGRPKKTFTWFVQEIKKDGYESVSKMMVSEAIDALLGLDEKRLASIVKDTERPMVLRIVAKSMLEKDGFHIFEKLLDRSHGTPRQTQDVSYRGGWSPENICDDEEVMGLMQKIDSFMRQNGWYPPSA